MDLREFRGLLGSSGVSIWAFIEAAIEVASVDYGDELRGRRDAIVSKLYYNPCPNCSTSSAAAMDEGRRENTKASRSPSTPVSVNEDDEELEEQERRSKFVDDDNHDDDDDDDDDDDVGDEEQRMVISIKEQIEDPHQSEDALVDLLQTLADMDITFKALKETDIGRHVNRLRKHPSNDVKRLVKLLVRKWKDLVDEWVKLNTPGEVQSSNNLIADGDSPQQNVSRNPQNGYHSQVPDFAYSPNPHNGSFGLDRNNTELEPRPKAAAAPRRDPLAKPTKSPTAPASAPLPNRQKEVVIDPDRLASARKRLQENYQEAQNAKKQRTIQVMDIHEIPKPKNGFFGRNKSGFQRH